MGLFNLLKSNRKVVVIDGVSLNGSLGLKGKVPPRNQLQMLRRVSRFAQREKLDLTIVLSGSPLHKAPARKKFDDVKVLYSKNGEEHAKYVIKTARSLGAGAIIISDDAAVEKSAGASTTIMRVSTFRKAFDANGTEADGSERSSGNRGGRNRQGRRKPQKQNTDKAPAPEKPRKESSDSDAINELIDLID